MIQTYTNCHLKIGVYKHNIYGCHIQVKDDCIELVGISIIDHDYLELRKEFKNWKELLDSPEYQWHKKGIFVTPYVRMNTPRGEFAWNLWLEWARPYTYDNQFYWWDDKIIKEEEPKDLISWDDEPLFQEEVEL